MTIAISATLATRVIIVLCAVGIVSLVAWLVRSRLVFVLGLIGIAAAQFVPEDKVYADYREYSVPAALEGVDRARQHVTFYTACGAWSGVFVGAVIVAIRDGRRRVVVQPSRRETSAR